MFYEKWIKSYRQEMEFKGYSESTIDNYIKIVYKFLYDFSVSYSDPKKISSENIKIWIK